MKERAILENRDVLQSVFDDLTVLANWYNKYNVEVTETRKIYDHRDMAPMSYLLIDLDSISEDQREETYKNELEKLQKAFDTLDPQTGRPYPEAIKPYLERIYTETAGKMSYDIDWNDKKEVMKFTRAMLLMQTVGSMFDNFPKEYFEIFPDPVERARIDAGIVQNQAMFNRTNEIIKHKHKIDLQSLNQLSLFSGGQTFQWSFIEYFNYTGAHALLSGSNEIVFDPSVDQVLEDYFSGNQVTAEEYDDFHDVMMPYTNEMAAGDFWEALFGLVKYSHAEWMTVAKFQIDKSDHFMINGRTLSELIEEEKKTSELSEYEISGNLIRDALTDGKSRVELVKFSHDTEGNVTFNYHQIKLDLSKLKLKDSSITNEQRDINQKDPILLREIEYRRQKYEKDYVNRLTNAKASRKDKNLIVDSIPSLKLARNLEAYDVITDREIEYLILDDKSSGFKPSEKFNPLEHLESHKVAPSTVVENINFVIGDIAGKGVGTVEQKMAIIRAAQVAAYKYLIVNPTPDTPADKAAHDAFRLMIHHPKKAFASIMSKELLKALRKAPDMKEYTKALMSDGKEIMNAARTEARAAEETYKHRVEELTNRLKDTKSELVFEEYDKKYSALIEEQRTLEEGLQALRDAEIARLEQAYANGKLPLDYFEQRRVAVEQGKHDRKVPFGVDERPSFKQFKAENAADFEGMSTEEVKYLYNSMMENAQREEMKFIFNVMEKQETLAAEAGKTTVKDERKSDAVKESIVVGDAMDQGSGIVSEKIDAPSLSVAKERDLQ